MEDYKKKYEEVLDEATVIYKCGNKEVKQIMEQVFPELRESEDGRIRKMLIAFVKNDCIIASDKNKQDALTWLEKQDDVNKEYWRGYREGKQEIIDKYTELEKQSKENPSLALENAAGLFLKALSDTPYNNKPITDAQVITKQLLNFLQNSASYNPDALNDSEPSFCHHEVDFSNCSEEYKKAYYDGWNNCNQQHSQLEAEKEAC